MRLRGLLLGGEEGEEANRFSHPTIERSFCQTIVRAGRPQEIIDFCRISALFASFLW